MKRCPCRYPTCNNPDDCIRNMTLDQLDERMRKEVMTPKVQRTHIYRLIYGEEG